MQYHKPNPWANQMRQVYQAPQSQQAHAGSYPPTHASHPQARGPVSFYQPGTNVANLNMKPQYNPGRNVYQPTTAPAGYLPQQQGFVNTEKPFILFIKTPGMTKTGIPDGSAHAAYIYNATPKEFRRLIHIHFLDKQPVRPPGLTGYPQIYDRTKNVYIPYGTKTILSLLHMVRNIGINIRMANLHPSSAKFDSDVAQIQQQINKRQAPSESQGQFRARELSGWKLKVEQNAENPYDPSLKADSGIGGDFLDGAPLLSQHFNDCADVDLFETGAREDFGESPYGSPINEFNFVEIDESKMNTSKISETEMGAYANMREKHWSELKSRLPAPTGRSAVE